MAILASRKDTRTCNQSLSEEFFIFMHGGSLRHPRPDRGRSINISHHRMFTTDLGRSRLDGMEFIEDKLRIIFGLVQGRQSRVLESAGQKLTLIC